MGVNISLEESRRVDRPQWSAGRAGDTGGTVSATRGAPMRPLDSYARKGLWAAVVWAVLLCYATFSHQPPYQTDFADGPVTSPAPSSW